MGLGEFLKKQFIDVIQWTEADDSVLAYRFPMRDMEIQMGAQLIVRETQAAVFVNEGRIADVFGPGRHRLDTQNLPLLTNLRHWDKLFESPFKSDVYFVSTRLRLNQRWGTQTPVTVRDAEFGIARIRAYGTYAYRIADPVRFHTEVSGTREVYAMQELEGQLRNLAITRMSDTLAGSGIAFLDLAANQVELGEQIAKRLAADVAEFGLALEGFVVENLSLPDELQQRLDERIGMGIIGNNDRYAQFQAARSIPVAAANEGGGAGIGAGLGAGMAMGQMMAEALRPQSSGAPQPGAPAQPAPPSGTCTACKTPLVAAAKFCPECGTKRA
jgi:membrane protease subunit (stomatin/prohibitin family)